MVRFDRDVRARTIGSPLLLPPPTAARGGGAELEEEEDAEYGTSGAGFGAPLGETGAAPGTFTMSGPPGTAPGGTVTSIWPEGVSTLICWPGATPGGRVTCMVCIVATHATVAPTPEGPTISRDSRKARQRRLSTFENV